MCLGCDRAWTVLHVLWSAIYVICGAAQLIAGIFFFISIPSIHLSSNLWAGTWNIVIGIGVGMLACFARVSSKRQEFLLYMAASILIVNAVNAVMSEWAYYVTDMKEVLGSHRYVVLIEYACLATRLAASVVILTSFLDTQFAFCSMQSVPKRSTDNKKKRRGCANNTQEQVSDIEYIIPRRKNSKPQTTILNAYSQSWVYDADVIAPVNNHAENSSYLKNPQEVAPIVNRRESVQEHSDTTHLIDNPVVHVEEASDDSNSNSDRKLCYMKSFSRATSPAVLSPSSSQVSLNNPPIYECLQRVIEPEIYRSRLNTALSDSAKSEKQYQAPHAMRSPKVEKVQYASLMKELQKAIVNKKETTSSSPPSSSSDKTQSSKSKNSDAEFSKELEAALQLIQDLESPNTVETPSSEPGPVWRNSDEDEKTLSAADSPISEQALPELTSFKPMINGKTACVLIRNSESQSTSGYSSPTHKTPDWSTTSSVNSDHGKHNLSYTIHNTKSSAVISLYADETTPKAKNVTLVSISGDDIESCPHSTVLYNETIPMEEVKSSLELDRRSSNGSNLWSVKSLLRKKKGFPKMCAELEGAIIKSESLAYLSENELLERHQRSKDIQRQIEQRVLQQLGTPRSESQC